MIEELEKTYLAKYLPQDLKDSPFEEIIDIYIPKSIVHPKLRLRKKGEKIELTKKGPKDKDVSHLIEETIKLDKEEYEIFSQIEGKKVVKLRYYYKFNEITAEFDIFQGDLKGLVLVDVEFKTIKEKDNFKMPDFCLEEVTQEDFIAGGMLAGKCYKDIEKDLKRYNYSKLFLK